MDEQSPAVFLSRVHQRVTAETVFFRKFKDDFVSLLMYLGYCQQLREIPYVRDLDKIDGRLRNISETVDKLVDDLVFIVSAADSRDLFVHLKF